MIPNEDAKYNIIINIKLYFLEICLYKSFFLFILFLYNTLLRRFALNVFTPVLIINTIIFL